MNSIIYMADTLQIVKMPIMANDTIVCKVISLQTLANNSIDWTWIIIVLLIFILLMVWLISKICLENKRLSVEKSLREKQHVWEKQDDNERRYYKYQDQLIESQKEKSKNKDKIEVLEKLTQELYSKVFSIKEQTK